MRLLSRRFEGDHVNIVCKAYPATESPAVIPVTAARHTHSRLKIPEGKAA